MFYCVYTSVGTGGISTSGHEESAGDEYTAGDTGGSAETTLSVDNLPSHTHGLNNHTHSFTPSGSVTVITNPTFTGTPVTSGGMSANNTGEFSIPDAIENNGKYSSSGCIRHSRGSNDYTAHWYQSHIQSHIFSMDFAHTHSVTAKGSISGGVYTFTGTKGTTGGASGNTTAAGSGTAFSNMPPHVVKYCWERIA